MKVEKTILNRRPVKIRALPRPAGPDRSRRPPSGKILKFRVLFPPPPILAGPLKYLQVIAKVQFNKLSNQPSDFLTKNAMPPNFPLELPRQIPIIFAA